MHDLLSSQVILLLSASVLTYLKQYDRSLMFFTKVLELHLKLISSLFLDFMLSKVLFFISIEHLSIQSCLPFKISNKALSTWINLVQVILSLAVEVIIYTAGHFYSKLVYFSNWFSNTETVNNYER